MKDCKDCKSYKDSRKLIETRLLELESEIRELQTTNTKLAILAKDNGLTDSDLDKISDTEAICVEQILKLKEQSANRPFGQEDAKILDILHSNLIRARGGKVDNKKNRKTKLISDIDLLKLVNN